MASVSGSAAAFASVELESDCPVCFEPFNPPVYQCSNGHLICHTCEPQCNICSVCREEMPKKKIRNIAFEKILSGLSKVPGPCPQQIHGCPAMLMKNEVEAHKLECGFIEKKICSLLGLYCNKEHCTANVNELISHFTFDHNMDGSLGTDTTDDDNDNGSPSNSKLELVSTCKKSELNKYLARQWSIPNFLKFDQKIFFIKKNVNVANKTVSIMVCIDASLKTAEMYSAIIQLLPGTSACSSSNNTTASASTCSSNAPPGLPPFTFNQEKVLLLTTEFDQKKTIDSKSKYCTIPFSTILTYGKSSGTGKPDLSWVIHADIKKIAFGSEPAKPSSSNATNTKIKSPSTSTLSPARAAKTRKLNTPTPKLVRTRRSAADSSTVGSTSSSTRSGGISVPQSSNISTGHASSARGQRGGRRQVGRLTSKTASASTRQPRRQTVPTTTTVKPKKVVKKLPPAKSTTVTTGALGRRALSGTSRRRSAAAPRTYADASSSSSSSDSTDSSDTSSEEESDSGN